MSIQILLMIDAIQEHFIINKIFFTSSINQECSFTDFTIIISLKITAMLKSFFINMKLIIFNFVQIICRII